MKTLSNWGSVRQWEGAVKRGLHQRHSLRLHGWCIGLLVLAAMWAAARLQMRLGGESMALRYLLTLGAGYLVYLLILRLWAGALLRRESGGRSMNGDLPDVGFSSSVPGGLPNFPGVRSGGGGDFGGGGASGDFLDAEAPDAAWGLGDVASGAFDVAAGVDDGAIVVVPVVAVFLIGIALIFGVGSLLMLYFGWEALLAVAVELAFSYVSARTAVRVVREGWVTAAVRLTWKPMLGALLCAVLLGAVMDHYLPTAQSLPQAIRLLRSSR